MNISSFPLTAILIPFIAAFIIGFIKEKHIKIKKLVSVLAVFISFVFTVLMIKSVIADGNILTYWLGSRKPSHGWAIGIGIEVDALSLFVGIIISFACFLSSIYSLKYMSKDNGLGKYYSLFLLLSGSMIGFVFSGDLFNMYVMLEIMTFAAIALTAFRTEKYKSLEAGFKYLVIGGLGSSLILLGTILIYFEAHTLNIAQIALIFSEKKLFSPVMILALSCMITGYAVKAFIVPCHTWPPDAHMAAPSSISMLLSGIMSKTGVYGLVRLLFIVFGLTGNKALSYLIVFLGTLTMLVGVSMALLQSDLKRLLAFHSVSQLGYVITGIGIGLLTSSSIGNIGLLGGLYHMLNHAVFKSLLFLCAGAILYKTGTTDLNKMSGLSKRMPFTTFAFIIGAAAISGLPPFNGFSSKWLIYQASFDADMPFVTIISVLVSSMTLASFIKVIHSAFFGKEKEENKSINEISLSMKIPISILSILCIALGIFSKYVINNLLKPVVKSIRNVSAYVLIMFNKQGSNSNLINDLSKMIKIKYNITGAYRPIVFLFLFCILVIAILISVEIINKGIGFNKYVKNDSSYKDICAKYEVFTGGEKIEDIKVGPHDLFWGLKFNFKGYFSKIQNTHSGIVNDYVLWVVVTLIVIVVYCFCFL